MTKSSLYRSRLLLVIVSGLWSNTASAFSPHPHYPRLCRQIAPPPPEWALSTARTATETSLRSTSSSSSTDTSSKQQQKQKQQQLESAVQQLKKVLQREYASFFDPFERAYYQPDVTFCDPLATLTGLDAYQNNVDMLAGRTWLGRVLFRDASIQLHTITGGDINNNNNNNNDPATTTTTSTTTDGTFSIANITTRWTLRFCFKILPWQPVARFTGISVYQVKIAEAASTAADNNPVQIVRQDDYWDSINLRPGGRYEKVDQLTAIQDFVQQLQPSAATAVAAPQQAGPELPYQLLRRGADYEVRQYPAFSAAMVPYERRDEGYAALGSFCKGLVPMAPAIMQIVRQDNNNNNNNNNNIGPKTMMWPLTYARPGEDTPAPPKVVQNDERVQVVTIPSRIVAVGRFADASVEPVVRKAHRALQASCERDGLELEVNKDESALQFCQYDAIFSMGQRRGEVWIPLKEGNNPWSNKL